MTRRQDQQRPKQMIRETFQYFEACTWFGPEHEKNIGAANALVPAGFTGLADWARLNMKPSPASVRSPRRR